MYLIQLTRTWPRISVEQYGVCNITEDAINGVANFYARSLIIDDEIIA